MRSIYLFFSINKLVVTDIVKGTNIYFIFNLKNKMELSNILDHNPELIFQNQVLNSVFSKLNFIQFFDTVIGYPDVYENLSRKQEYWKDYMQHNNPNFYSKVVISPKTNWFYEIIMATISPGASKYYYSSKTMNLLTRIIPNFKLHKPVFNEGSLSVEQSYSQLFNIDNELRVNDILFPSYQGQRLDEIKSPSGLPVIERNTFDIGITPPSSPVIERMENSPPIIQRNIVEQDKIKLSVEKRLEISPLLLKQISSYSNIIVALFTNGDVVSVDTNLNVKVIAKNIKKPLYDYEFLLTGSNQLLKILPDIMETEIVNLPFTIKDIQEDSLHMISIIDTNNNLYSIQFNSRHEDLLMNHGIRNPLLRNTEVLSYTVLNRGNIEHIIFGTGGLPIIPGQPREDNAFFTTLYYVDMNGDLFYINYRDYISIHEARRIYTYQNVKVKKIWSKTIEKSYWVTADTAVIYQDTNNNIYEYNGGINIKYQLPNNEHVNHFYLNFYEIQKFIMLTFITYGGKIYHHFHNTSDVVGDIIHINPNDGKQFPPGTAILGKADSNGVLLEVSEPVSYVRYPYLLYLFNRLQRNVTTDAVSGNEIIFRLKNNPYVFRTTMIKENKKK